MTDRPTGAEMVKKTIRVKDLVHDLLIKFPTTRGDDRVLTWRFLREYTPLRLTFSEFEQLRRCPSFESIRRRRQELVREFPDLQPSERVQKKRAVRASALKHYFSTGMKLSDFEGWDEREEQ